LIDGSRKWGSGHRYEIDFEPSDQRWGETIMAAVIIKEGH